MTNKEFSRILLEKRTRNFAVQIIKLCSALPNSPEIRVIRYQLRKSATSIGANYHEANRSRSDNDLKHKLKICESEANETLYWLHLANDLNLVKDKTQFNEVIKEVKEFIAIFTSSGKKLKEKVK